MSGEYEINSDTLMIVPVNSKISKIIECNEEFLIEKNTTEIIDDSCKFFGSSYSGRFEGTKRMIGVNYKAPIVVEESREIIFFPTSSPRFDNCYWICLNKIESYEKCGKNTKIVFKNKIEYIVPISYRILENQILRSTLLESKLRSRKYSKMY